MVELPPRYEALHRLGQGGGGEVWAVRDRILGSRVALKVLAANAGEQELVALVREAAALSGLEGLGVPRVLAFGALADGRRFMVRELVEGRSLDEIFDQSVMIAGAARDWLAPLAHAADQLTALHRAGLLHGDVKPANVIAGTDRRGTLVDLGLAAPWREGGTRARGLTPKYAAPELLTGGAFGVRQEVYALAATLAEGLARRGADLADDARIALAKVAARGMDPDPQKRFPSTSEIASAMRAVMVDSSSVARETKTQEQPGWPVVGMDAIAQDLASAIRGLRPGDAVSVVAPRGAGRSTLLRRVAWTLGIEGKNVVLADAPRTELSRRDALALDLGEASAKTILVIDDGDSLDDETRALVHDARKKGARAVIGGSDASAKTTIEIPPLDEDAIEDLLKRAMPSLPIALAKHLAERTGRRPGPLRAAVRALADLAIVSERDIDEALADESIAPIDARELSPEQTLERAERLIEIGRVTQAESLLGSSREMGQALKLRAAIAEARLFMARGEGARAVSVLEKVDAADRAGSRAWSAAMSRAFLRAGKFTDAIAAARPAMVIDDAVAVEALGALGVAHAYLGEDAKALENVERAVSIAKKIDGARGDALRGFALGSLGVVHQRASRTALAKVAYREALAAAEIARDASTVAATRLNLAGLAREEGDIASALENLEATVDLGKRAGGLLAVLQARVNLINLDLFLGRHARARAAIDAIEKSIPDAMRAQLTGCRAELASRTGDDALAAELYESCALAYEKQGRTSDAIEARLEGLLVRVSPPPTMPELDDLDADEAHRALALLVRGAIEARLGRDVRAKTALDRAVEAAKAGGQQERTVWALAARARVLATLGQRVQSRRDIEAALALLEESASKLPRDLREVFWNEPRRAALHAAAHVTAPSMRGPTIAKPDPTLSSISIGGRADSTSAFPPFESVARPAEDKLARVLEIVRELATEHDLSRLLAKVTDHALALLGGERGFVVLENDDGMLEVFASRDRKGDDPHARFSRSVAEKVVETGEPVVATRAREDARLAEAVSVHQLAIQSIACVPIRGAPPLGRPIGALYVETRVRPGARFEEELPILCAFADQAAIAIENARLTSELARKNSELEAARQKLEGTLGRRNEQLAEARRDLGRVRAGLKSHFGYAGLVGTSASMRKVYALIDRIKDTDVPALVTGESGTGKEVVARAIHQASDRAKKSFTGINCGAIPANLLESELFGHVRGAFTGADRDRKGLLRESEGGTLLLDEIGEMPLKMQAGMLRLLQEKTVRPVGGANEERVDVRIIAATNRDLEEMVREGSFREDLYYRLHVVELRVPPLRERSEDVLPLIDHFLTVFATRYRREKKSVSREALRRLTAYEWPGNVRQLEHVLLNAWLMSDRSELQMEDVQLPDQSRPASSSSSSRRSSPARNETEYKDSEKERILRALAACNWNRVKAAELTGIPRRTFYRRLKEFGIL